MFSSRRISCEMWCRAGPVWILVYMDLASAVNSRAFGGMFSVERVVFNVRESRK